MDNETPKNRGMLILGSIALLLIVLSFLPMRWFQKETYQNNSQTDSLALVKEKLTGDHINSLTKNNLPNWKQALYDSVGQDPNTPVTKVPLNNSDQRVLDDPNNLTSQFAKNAYAVSAYLDQQGVTDQNAIDSVSKSVVSGSLSILLPKTYTRNDLKITSKNDMATLKNYGNDISLDILNMFKVSSGIDDIGIVSSYIENNNSKTLEKYNVEIDAFTKLRDQLKNMTVPESALSYHLDEINSVESFLGIIINLSKSDTDPLRALISAKAYANVVNNLMSSIKNYRTYFDSQNVIFTPKEYGYFLTQAILK